MIAKEIIAPKEMLSTLHRNSRENGLRESQELQDCTLGSLETVEGKTFLRRDHGGTLLTQKVLGSCFTMLSQPGTQRLLQL